MLGLHLNVRDHDSHAVSAQRVSEEVGKSGLSVWDVLSFLIRESQDHLLEESQTFVDVSSLIKLLSLSVGLLKSLGSSQIYKVKLRGYNFLS